jgi:hypothetical protein
MSLKETSELTFEQRLARDKQLIRDTFDRLDKGEQVDFESLRGALGVKLTPTTWEELEKILADGSEEALATLGRTPQDLKTYSTFTREVITKQWASATDYLLCKVFGAPSRPEAGQATGSNTVTVHTSPHKLTPDACAPTLPLHRWEKSGCFTSRLPQHPSNNVATQRKFLHVWSAGAGIRGQSRRGQWRLVQTSCHQEHY